MSSGKLRILMFGDIVGAPGRALFQKHAKRLKEEFKADAIIVNGENSATKGKGITSRIVKSFRHNGADVITTGNHIWFNKEIYGYIDQCDDLLRPANFPSACPGRGVTTFMAAGKTIGVVNVQGRTYMNEEVSCPFIAVDTILTYLKHKTNIILVDMHAEASSEKIALAHYLDGRVSAVVGTHTHVQTADERILPRGTGYITDLGMSGALNSIIGVKKEPVIERFLTQMPRQFEVDTQGPFFMNGVCFEIDADSGAAVAVTRFRVDDNVLEMNDED